MNKTVKKIVALGFGALMLGMVAHAATAVSLSDYPAPFVQNGEYKGKIVIGEKAMGIDTVGALDIAASLQRASGTAVSGSGSGSTASAEDGYKFSESSELIYGANLNSVIASVDDTELPDLLASGTVEADDGDDYDYDVEILFGATSTANVEGDISLNDLDDEYSTPVVYFDLNDGNTDLFYTVFIDFEDAWDAETFVESETIELFGRAYTFDPNNDDADDVLTLFGSDTTLIVTKGETKTIKYMGKDYTVEVLGGNSDDSNAILRIGSETKTVREGDSRTLGGLPIYVKDVFISNIGGDEVSVQLFLGSNKLELDVDGTVKLNGVTLDEVTVVEAPAGDWVDVDSISFQVTPALADEEVKAILPGESYVDPLFGAFKFSFVGAEDLMEGKELLKFDRVGKNADMTFYPRDGKDWVTVTLLEDGAVHEDLFVGSALNGLVKDEIFFYVEDSGDVDKAKTHVLQVTKVKDANDFDDVDFEFTVEDLTYDKTYTVTKCEPIDSSIPLYPEENGAGTSINLTTESDCDGAAATNNMVFWTEAGAKVQVYNSTDVALTSTVGLSATEGYFLVEEDKEDDADDTTATEFKVGYDWDGAEDDEYDFAVDDAGAADGPLDDDDDYDHWLSEFGTYVVEENDDSGKYVYLYIPAKEATYDMFLLPVASEVTVTSTSGGGTIALNPIAVGMAILDSEASLGSRPYIVVGGPCANTVSAALMGNPADCAAGFVEGKGVIKLYTDKNALLVAGYAGKDTQGACRVLAEYKTFASKFKGTELEVITTNLNSLSVNSVQ